MPEISIIVPIYNVELYLNKCIDSILTQTFTDFELILVNDGSTDTCGSVCDSYAKKDNRIKVIHKINAGVSTARNIGIEIAKGEYIAFVDPDDTIESKMYELLLQSAKYHKADMVVCPIKSINLINNSISISSIWRDVNISLDKETIEKHIIPSILGNKTYSLISSVNKLYKKSLFEKLRFEENKHHSEDARLNFTLLTIINKLVYIKHPFYNYYIRKRDSLTQMFREDLYEYARDNKRFLIQLCKKMNLNNYINVVRHHFTTVTLLHMQDVVNRNISSNKKHKIITEILNDKEFMKDISIYNCPSTYYKLLRRICMQKNCKVFMGLVKLKTGFQETTGWTI